MLNKIIRYFLENRLVAFLLLFGFIAWGITTAPFNWKMDWFPRNPVAVDAIPDIGENQQIIATEWMGRNPEDIENQITYPLSTALLGIPGVKDIRSTSMFGMSFIYIIFEEKIDFYWSRSRILEKLNSLPSGTLPQGVQPTMGPDATALGQVYWYTLEGRDPKTGKPTGGWDPQELRTIQDFYLKYSLNAVEGVSEVASIGGFVKEYQVDINPDALKAANIDANMVMMAVKKSNIDVGAGTIEINRAQYYVRGLGYIQKLADLENAVVDVRNNVPIRIKDVATVNFGPEIRIGGLDKEGSETVGAVVVARYQSNPLQVIENIKTKIKEIAPGLPSKKLADGSISKVTVIPFYDRTGLIKETIGTLESSLSHEILISIIVIIVLLMNLRASFIVAFFLPVGVLMAFGAMKLFGIDANIVALSGIAIAIGVMIDLGIVDVENIIRHLEMTENKGARGKKLLEVIYSGTTEVRAAVTVALATTIVGFLPVFAMEAAEGKLFTPLAYTKTFAMVASYVVGMIALPALTYYVFSLRAETKKISRLFNISLIIAGPLFFILWSSYPAIALTFIGINNTLENRWSEKHQHFSNLINNAILLLVAVYYLSIEWMPLGVENSLLVNILFVGGIIAIILSTISIVVHYYENMLRWCLNNRFKFMLLPFFTLLLGLTIWLGSEKIFGWMANGVEKIGWNIRQTSTWETMVHQFPGTGKEFMPSLDEGSFLLMPTTMPHSGVEENMEVIALLDQRVRTIPEVEEVVGKWGRVNSALDPSPISMYENLINYKPEYILNEDGHRIRFKINEHENFILKDGSTYNIKEGYKNISLAQLIIDEKDGAYFRQWRPEIKTADDIWKKIIKAASIPGMTSAPKIQPIETRLIMLQTGMRAPMGMKVYGPDLATIEKVGIDLENVLKEVPSVLATSVFADRIVGTPYLEINIDREAIARYGLTIEDMQTTISSAIGGMKIGTTVEGRERFPIRMRYARAYRDNPEDLKKILIPTPSMTQVPLDELAEITYKQGPQMIRGENTFLTGFVIFDKKPNYAEVDVVEEAQRFIDSKIKLGELVIPAGVSYKFSGNFENQVRATKRLMIVVPISLLLIFLILYFQFKTVTASFIHFSGVFVAFAGGFILIWLYGQDWFMNFSVAGTNIRDLFQMHPINLSVAVWVGFIALFGIATDDGVIMGTYIHQTFKELKPATIEEVKNAVIIAGKKRVRPAMMTGACAIIALLPILTSTGKGSDVMVPIAIPTFGGMVIQMMTMLIVPVLQYTWRVNVIKKELKQSK
ncbi:MAG: cation transporter [Flavobacteriales bacterium CG_4_10_14_0_2_um_filter_32_8]|nr:MAG: cation transporter [Flavobacteriales bacterium CG_4_10_14_0_2_um_filter_32_8]PJB16129.1 MAG: cation transporter [Flavobacteriales bacterium CG_4_9_14_3_um_filter_32_8]